MHNNKMGQTQWVCAERVDGAEPQGPSKPVKGSLLSEDTWKLAGKAAHETAQTPSRFPYADRCNLLIQMISTAQKPPKTAPCGDSRNFGPESRCRNRETLFMLKVEFRL